MKGFFALTVFNLGMNEGWNYLAMGCLWLGAGACLLSVCM